MWNMITHTATKPQKIRVAIVEDDTGVLARFQRAIAATTDLELLAHFGNGTSALAWLEHNSADVLLCDLGLPDFSGLAVIGYCAQKYPASNIMVITMYEDEDHVVKSLEAGASGYLLKDSLNGEIAEQIRELHAGGSPMTPVIARLVLKRFRITPTPVEPEKKALAFTLLTDREIDILARISQGFSYAEIASIEKISTHTVATHIKHIYGKLSVHSKSEAVYEAMQMGLLDANFQKVV
jgi:DNA-binding NarL/FixJ family response regulator